MNDGLGEPYTAGSAFDAEGNLYVTDDLNGDISEITPHGNALADLRHRTLEPPLSGV